MINLTPEEWTQISLGDLVGILEKASLSGDIELKKFIESRQAHIKDKGLFNELYLWKGNQKLDFPSEYFNGFILDQRLEAVLQLIKKYNLKTVLDIGSRAGYLLFAGRQRNIIDSGTGVEIATCYYDLCNRAVEHFKIENLEFINLAFEDFETSKKYDCAVIAEVLEHIVDPLSVLKKTKELLNPAGFLIITVPASRGTATPEEINIIKSEKIQEHIHFFNKESLINLGQSAGFKNAEYFSVNQGWVNDIAVFMA
jgi:2-polyprenyl-3-methyl-5-hydroxy-6-metoxy-1,4-benzoquinol methylase